MPRKRRSLLLRVLTFGVVILIFIQMSVGIACSSVYGQQLWPWIKPGLNATYVWSDVTNKQLGKVIFSIKGVSGDFVTIGVWTDVPELSNRIGTYEVDSSCVSASLGTSLGLWYPMRAVQGQHMNIWLRDSVFWGRSQLKEGTYVVALNPDGVFGWYWHEDGYLQLLQMPNGVKMTLQV